jgi:hypothetical protein
MNLDADLPVVDRVRDLLLLRLDEARVLVVACDSSGGIGPKEADSYRATAREVAHFACRVALLEVIAAGARPLVIVDNLCVESTPTGAAMIDEVRRVASEMGLDPSESVTGSTEDNVPTRSTGIGVTVLGLAARAELRPGVSQVGDAVVCLGVPRSAPRDRVEIDDALFVSARELMEILTVPGVHDALPVGSRGIAYEAAALASEASLSCVFDRDVALDISCSAGPSTCVLLSCRSTSVARLRALRHDLPVAIIGTLVAVEPS